MYKTPTGIDSLLNTNNGLSIDAIADLITTNHFQTYWLNVVPTLMSIRQGCTCGWRNDVKFSYLGLLKSSWNVLKISPAIFVSFIESLDLYYFLKINQARWNTKHLLQQTVMERYLHTVSISKSTNIIESVHYGKWKSGWDAGLFFYFHLNLQWNFLVDKISWKFPSLFSCSKPKKLLTYLLTTVTRTLVLRAHVLSLPF